MNLFTPENQPLSSFSHLGVAARGNWHLPRVVKDDSLRLRSRLNPVSTQLPYFPNGFYQGLLRGCEEILVDQSVEL